MQDELM